MQTGSKISKQDLRLLIDKIKLTDLDITNIKIIEYINKMLEPTKKGSAFDIGECALLYALKNDKWTFLETTFKSKHKGYLFDFMTTPSTKDINNIKKDESPVCYLIRMKQWNVVEAFIKDLEQTQIETLYSHSATGTTNTNNESIMHYVIRSLDTDYLKSFYENGFIQLSLDKKTVLTSFYQLFSEIQSEINLNPKNKEGHSPLSLAIMLGKHAQYILEIISFFKKQPESILNDSYGDHKNTILDLLKGSLEHSYSTYYFEIGENRFNINGYVLKIGGKNSKRVSEEKLGLSSATLTTTHDPYDIAAISLDVPLDIIHEKQEHNEQHKKTLESKRNYSYITKTILGGLAGLGLAYFIAPMAINSVFLTAHFPLMAISLTIIGAALGFSNAYLNDNLSAEIVTSQQAHEAFEDASSRKSTSDYQKIQQQRELTENNYGTKHTETVIIEN